MDIRNFYETTGGDYEDAMKRFLKESRLEKFVRMFPDDPSYGELESGLARKNVEDAFRAAHTLKGVCMNLSFAKLYTSVYEVTEALRNADPENEEDMSKVYAGMDNLTRDYSAVMESIKNLA